MEARLVTHDLSIGYHSRHPAAPVASGLDLALPAGQLTCLIGPNGVGKSTLLRTLAGLQKPLHGNIFIDGISLMQSGSEELARRISVVLTDSSHPGDLRVRQVVELGRLPYTNWLGSLSEPDHQIVSTALEQVNAQYLARRSFGELSDGERQKVMIARALAQDPAVMILDEPTAFLDWPNRVDLLVTLKKIARKTGKAILISSHDLDLVLNITDLLWVMGPKNTMITGKCADVISSGALELVFSNPNGRLNLSGASFKVVVCYGSGDE